MSHSRAADIRTWPLSYLVTADSDEYTLELWVKPDADLDGTFRAWDEDESEWLKVNGWLFIIEDR